MSTDDHRLSDREQWANRGRVPVSDVYPVGLLADIKRRRVLRSGMHYVRYQLGKRDWRAVRNYFRNGWLTEHRHPCSHNAGWGWTKRASERRARRECV